MAERAASAPPSVIERVTAWALSLRPVRALLHYTEHRGPMLADSVTYRTLFSVFAGVLLGFTLAAAWLAGNPAAFDALVASVDAAIPGLLDVVDPSEIAVPGALTLAGVLSLVALVGAALGAIGSLRIALRTLADKVHDDVFFVWVLLRNLVLAVGIGAAFAAAAAITFFANVGIGVVTDWFGLSEGDPLAVISTRGVSILVVFVLDAAAIAVLFRALSGVRPRARTLIVGSLLGGIGLSVLQQLSSLFVGGASNNPLLASFASLIALLLWFNLSAQVILIASSYIIVSVAEESDRVRERHGAPTMPMRRVRNAENAVRVATEELASARADVEKQAAAAAEKRAKAAAKS